MNSFNEYLYQKNILRREEIEIPVSIDKLNEILSKQTDQKEFSVHKTETDHFYFLAHFSWAVVVGTGMYFLRKHNEIAVFADLTPIDTGKTRLLLCTKLRLVIYFITALFSLFAIVILLGNDEKLIPLVMVVVLYPIFIAVFGFAVHWQEKYLMVQVKKFLRGL